MNKSSDCVLCQANLNLGHLKRFNKQPVLIKKGDSCSISVWWRVNDISHIHSVVLPLLLAATCLLTYVVILILVVILIWRPAQSHTYSCPVVGLPITISQCLAGNTRGGMSTHQELIRHI